MLQQQQEGQDTYHHPLTFPPRSLSLDSGRAAAAAAVSSSSASLAGVGGAFQQSGHPHHHHRRWDGVLVVEDGPWSQPVSVFELDSSDEEGDDEEEEDGYGEDETGLDSDDEAELLALAM